QVNTSTVLTLMMRSIRRCGRCGFDRRRSDVALGGIAARGIVDGFFRPHQVLVTPRAWWAGEDLLEHRHEELERFRIVVGVERLLVPGCAEVGTAVEIRRVPVPVTTVGRNAELVTVVVGLED